MVTVFARSGIQGCSIQLTGASDCLRCACCVACSFTHVRSVHARCHVVMFPFRTGFHLSVHRLVLRLTGLTGERATCRASDRTAERLGDRPNGWMGERHGDLVNGRFFPVRAPPLLPLSHILPLGGACCTGLRLVLPVLRVC